MRRPDMTWRADTEGRCTWVSASYSSFVGRDAQDAREDGWVMAIHLDDRDQVLANVRARTQLRLGFVARYRLRGADGEHYWVRDVGSPTFDRAGTCVGYHGHVSVLQASKRTARHLACSEVVPFPQRRRPMVPLLVETAETAMERLAESR